MVKNTKQDSAKEPVSQGAETDTSQPNKIRASTPYDFEAKNLTAYGGLFPIGTMLEKLGFQQLVEETLTVKRVTRVMSMYQFLLSIILTIYVGFSRLNHIQFVQREPMLTGLLQVTRLPPQCTFWRFLASLRIHIAAQILKVQRQMRQRVWEAAHVDLKVVTLDTDTTVHTLFGRQMGGRKSYNPKNRGKKSYQPILTFLAETREYIAGELRNGDRPSGKQIAQHLDEVAACLPKPVQSVYLRTDSGLYCWDTVQACEAKDWWFILSVRKSTRLREQLEAAKWTKSFKTDADGECEFRYQPEGWAKAYRFVALRYLKKPKVKDESDPEQYQLFDTPQYSYRVFVTNIEEPVWWLEWFYRQRGGAENLIKEANNDAGLAAHPSGRFETNRNYFQLAMLAYNLNCWLMLFNREEDASSATMQHTKLSTARLRFLFVAAKIWRHGRRVGVSYSDHYAEQGMFQRLMDRLRAIAPGGDAFLPVLKNALT
jgi:Transposase DDE domain group 1